MNKIMGLSEKEVNKRKDNNLVNKINIKTKSVWKIIYDNVFTLFNFINAVIFVIILSTKSYKNLLFFQAVIYNTLIGLIYEIHAKKLIDKLSIINIDTIDVLRDTHIVHVNVDEIVLDDIIKYEIGNEVVVDSIIIEDGVIVNEAMITGESNPIYKEKDAMLLSGSVIVGGSCFAKCIHVGKDNYHFQITKDAKKFKKRNSLILNTLNNLLRMIGLTIIPLGGILIYKQINLDGISINTAIINSSSAIIGTIPQGLILLTSVTLAIGVIKLSKHNVLIQDLYSIEQLARVDTICIDKTGTITEKGMVFKNIIKYHNDADDIIANICYHTKDNNETMNALKKKYSLKHNLNFINTIPFSSDKKYSLYEFKEGTYALGAYDILMNEENEAVTNYSKTSRVLLLAKVNKNLSKTIPYALILLDEKIKDNVNDTIKFFKNNDIALKIVSGDSIDRVSSIAEKIGFKIVYSDELSKKSIMNNNIFARVKPEDKLLIVKTLMENGKTVLMIGDGANDVAAVSKADCGICLDKDSTACKNASNITVLNGDFSVIPKIILEGRSVINNLSNSACLFLNKTIYSVILSFIYLFRNELYPFIPIQLTLVSMLTIGIPGFLLTLIPNQKRVDGSFFKNIIKTSLPIGILISFTVLLVSYLDKKLGLNRFDVSTICVTMNAFLSFILLYRISKPFNKLKTIIFSLLVLSFISCLTLFNEFFDFSHLNLKLIGIIIILMIFTLILYKVITKFIKNTK